MKEKEKLADDMVTRLADVTSKAMYWESQVLPANQRLDLANAFVQDVEAKAKATEDRVKEVEMKAASMAS